MVTKGERVRRERYIGVWNYLIHTIIYEIDKQQRPPVQHRDYTQYPAITNTGKESEKAYICVYN